MHDRHQLRLTMLNAWKKAQAGEPLDELENEIAQVIQQHPEYHSLFDKGDAICDLDFETTTNPFLHMSLHIGLREQIRCDRPTSMRQRWLHASKHLPDTHDLEHRVMELMANLLWEAQQKQQTIDDADYLEALNAVLPLPSKG